MYIRKTPYLLPLLLVPYIVHAQAFRDVIYDTLLPLLQLVTLTIIALTVLYIMWNGVQMIMNADNAQKRADHRSALMWSVFVLFIMVGMWGLVEILQNTFGI